MDEFSWLRHTVRTSTHGHASKSKQHRVPFVGKKHLVQPLSRNWSVTPDPQFPVADICHRTLKRFACKHYLHYFDEAIVNWIVEAWSLKIACYFYTDISADSNGHFGGSTRWISDCRVSTIPDKSVGTRSKFSPPPTFNVDNRVIFSLFVGKNAIFSNID